MRDWKLILIRIGDMLPALFFSLALIACIAFSILGVYLMSRGHPTGMIVLGVFGLGALAIAPTFISELKRQTSGPHRISPEERLALKEAQRNAQGYEKQFEAEIEQLILHHAFEKMPGEMLPPWLMRILPFDLPTWEGHAYWTNGEGGYYWGRFLDFWVPLDLETKKSYFKRYDLGPDWSERYTWYNQLFDSQYAIDISDEAELDRLADELLD